MAKRKKTETAAPEPAPEPETAAAGDIPGDIPGDTEAAGLPEYPHCACGGRLVTEAERAAEVCEDCGHLGADGKLYKTPELAALANARHGDAVPGLTAELATRINAFAATRRSEYERLIAVDPSGEDGDVWGDYDKAEEAFIASLPEDFPLDASALMGDVENGTWTPLPVPGAPTETPVEASAEAPAPEESATAEATPAPAEPVQWKLPEMVSVFDFAAAFEDLACKARLLAASRAQHADLHKRAADLKKQIDAAEALYWELSAKYDEAKRDAEAEAIRQEKLRAAYVEKAEADAAKKAQGELPMEAPAVVEPAAESGSVAEDNTQPPTEPAAPSTVCEKPAADSPTPLTDALPTCPCGNALALDTEKARGTCDECDAMDPEGNEPEQRATC